MLVVPDWRFCRCFRSGRYGPPQFGERFKRAFFGFDFDVVFVAATFRSAGLPFLEISWERLCVFRPRRSLGGPDWRFPVLSFRSGRYAL